MISKFLASLLGIALIASPLAAQDKLATEDVPKAVISEVEKTPEGGLLFAVRISAPNGKRLKLMRKPAPRAPGDDQTGASEPDPFSLDASKLTDVWTGTVYDCEPTLPARPFLGPMAVTTDLAPGGWVQLAVAFPAIPPPPPDKKGNPQPYQLLFEIPELKISSLFFLDPVTLQPTAAPR